MEETSGWLGCWLDQNSRDRMEDVVDVKLIHPNGGLFVVLDGHNGRTSVDYVSQHLPRNILESRDFGEGNFEGALKNGFEKTEKELIEYLSSGPGLVSSPRGDSDLSEDFPKLTSGVVVCAVMIVENVVYSAHAGDCRAVLFGQKRGIVQLTEDHNLGNLIERQRVTKWIGKEGYVKGLMVTRSLGNLTVSGISGSLEKVEGQIASPDVSQTRLDEEDLFLLVGSDGLFEVMSNEVVVDTVLKAMKRPSFSPMKTAQELVDRAVSRGSSDNICVCLVMLDKFKIRNT